MVRECGPREYSIKDRKGNEMCVSVLKITII